METTDATFVARARTGDSDAFRVLVERHSRALFRLAFRMTGNQQDAEDVVQESFLRAYKQHTGKNYLVSPIGLAPNSRRLAITLARAAIGVGPAAAP